MTDHLKVKPKCLKFPLTWTLLHIVIALLCVFIRWPKAKLEMDLYFPDMCSSGGKINCSVESHEPLMGTTVVITGATNGIGLALTNKLFDLGAHVIAIGRSPEKLQNLENKLNKKRLKGITSVVADFGNLDEIAHASKIICKKFKRIDFLINNAGIHHSTIPNDAKTEQGFEATFGVNYLSHFLLTKKLMPLLQKSQRDKPRIIQISSSYHVQVDGYDLMPRKTSISNEGYVSRSVAPPLASIRQTYAYANSKLAQILHARALTRKLKDCNSKNKVQIVSVCPGWVATDIMGQGIFSNLLPLVAFDQHDFGLATIFHAMFHPNAGVPNQTDFIASNKLIKFLFANMRTHIAHRWLSKLNIRQMLIEPGVYINLLVQKFFAEVSFVSSSIESYDVKLQNALYEWSEQAISQ